MTQAGNSLGDAIRRARQRQGLTQAETAVIVHGSRAVDVVIAALDALIVP